MKLRAKTIGDLADMVAGGAGSSSMLGGPARSHSFPYRSGSGLTKFFRDLEIDREHSGSRIPWTEELLRELNEWDATDPALPADILIELLRELMAAEDFVEAGKDRAAALAHLNRCFARDGLEVFFDTAGMCQVRAGNVSSAGLGSRRNGAWTRDELQRRASWQTYLEAASEDEFIDLVLIPLLKLVGFLGVYAAGHKDKALEYGKDIRMKLRLPTGHCIYFAIQVKKGKLDAAGKSTGTNQSVTEVLNQVRMALDHEVFDPEINRTCLIDHVYVVATGDITKQAKNFLVEKLDREKRRQLIFMDRAEVLDLLARVSLPLPGTSESADFPF